MTQEIPKKQKLRNNEYYNMQEVFDDLYAKSKNRKKYRFNKLMDIIKSEENIQLAYRNIKKNKGSLTSGVNKKTILDIAQDDNELFVKKVQERLDNYHPHPVRRVEIPKPNGDKRPLGIPSIEDRIIQQCIKQVLEPICEGKFHNHSYGFRPNRSTHHAIARCYTLAQKVNFHYVVDVDIKGFFDNVNHSKLMKQMWSLGIQDKQLLCIIGKMLKAPINGIGVPQKGTPQGGILSPLLSNIVLNELDWWISDQWETYTTKRQYASISKKYRHLRTYSDLKELYIVRYADDFKIFCKDYETASKTYIATKNWLKERLSLEISESKSKIVNLKTSYSDFLGFKIRVHQKGDTMTVRSHVNDKAKKKMMNSIREQLKVIQTNTDVKNVNKYNSMILGMHNYYRVATHVNKDFSDVFNGTNKCFHNRTKYIRTRTSGKPPTKTYNKYYGKSEGKKIYIKDIIIFPISSISTSPPLNFSQTVCDYTKEGREQIHKKLITVPAWMICKLMSKPIENMSIEYNDNRISLFVAQKGICPITNEFLDIDNMDCHHKIPREIGGDDKYKNLIIVKREVHKLIHARDINIINKYLQKLNLNNTQVEKVNELRIKVGNTKIVV